jgi:hypothetical protein
MTIEELKQSIKDKELRLSQLRSMDTNRLKAEDRQLMKELEKEVEELKQRLGQE